MDFPSVPKKTTLQPLESIFNYCSRASLKYNNMALHYAYVYRWKCDGDGIDSCSKPSMWDSQRFPMWTDWPQGSKELTTDTQLQDVIDSGSLVTTLETACRGKSPAGKIVKGQWCTASSEHQGALLLLIIIMDFTGFPVSTEKNIWFLLKGMCSKVCLHCMGWRVQRACVQRKLTSKTRHNNSYG